MTFGYDHQITKESQDIGSQISVDLSKQDQPDQAYAGQHFFRSSDTKRHYKATPPLYASFPLFIFPMDHTRLILRALPSQSHSADIRIAPIAIGYQPPMKGRPVPVFSIPSRRFPIPAKRLLPTQFINPLHSPRHPGSFPADLFLEHIWLSAPIYITDHHITSIRPETQYFGIGYVVEVEEAAWDDQLICRGTTIIFRGYDSTITKYVATWLLEHDEDVAFVQFTAFQINQKTHHYDSEWPTLCITVPMTLCCVPFQQTESLVPHQEVVSLTPSQSVSPELPWWKNAWQWMRSSNDTAGGSTEI